MLGRCDLHRDDRRRLLARRVAPHAVADAIDLAYFPEHVDPGPYDLSLVEGSITTPHDAERIREVRARSKTLVTIGACATAGGIQALRNFRDHAQMMAVVYARPGYIATLATSTAIAARVEIVGVAIAHPTGGAIGLSPAVAAAVEPAAALVASLVASLVQEGAGA